MPSPILSDCRLYGFIDAAYLAGREPAELTRAMIAGGVDLIQVRAKNYRRPQRLALALAVVAAAQPSQVPVIVNDDIDVAFESGAAGVHLGQEDWAELGSGEERNQRLAYMQIVGVSTHSLTQARSAERDGANYLGLGPVFRTATKPDVTPIGLEPIGEVATRVSIPLFAIGGITLDNLDQVLAAGAQRVAVVSAILQAPDVEQAAAAFKKKLTANGKRAT